MRLNFLLCSALIGGETGLNVTSWNSNKRSGLPILDQTWNFCPVSSSEISQSLAAISASWESRLDETNLGYPRHSASLEGPK